MDLDLVPDIAMQGQDDPHGRVIAKRPPTVGQLAAVLRERARHPSGWWRLVRFDAARPTTVRLDGAAGTAGGDGGDVEIWLTTWPPGRPALQRRRDRDSAELVMLVAGELTEVTIAPHGATERPLRANRVRVLAARPGRPASPDDDASLRELVNPGVSFAVTLHAVTLHAGARTAGPDPSALVAVGSGEHAHQTDHAEADEDGGGDDRDRDVVALGETSDEVDARDREEEQPGEQRGEVEAVPIHG